MARLRAPSPIRKATPDDFHHAQIKRGVGNDRLASTAALRTSPRKKVPKTYVAVQDSDSEDTTREPTTLVTKSTTPTTHRRGRQIRLPPLTGTLCFTRGLSSDQLSARKTLAIKHRDEIKPLDYEVEESTWCGSSCDSDDSEELPSPSRFLRLPSKSSPNGTAGSGRFLSRCSSSSDESDNENDNAAFLRFSPPRLHSPKKQQQQHQRPVTPPQSPSKSRLQSPSKTKCQLPTPPLRQSLDAFWNSNAINDWNDQHSPHKVLKSPKKLKIPRDEASQSPTSSPRKLQSPSKVSKVERHAKKDFAARKRVLAEAFFDELDQVVTEGKIKELAASTGGVRFLWSKTLNSTAGRANWRKETSHIRMLDGTTEVRHKHHASIELAEKVIDDENRLLNVIAHEFCHLANFMVSGVKKEPHGRQFKAWGRKCTEAFRNRGVEVTTKHSYKIEYKYVWQCSNEDCAVEFKRHSKSIDPKRHTCGTCRSKLVQIKPTPRRDAGTTTGYAAYVKTYFAEVKRSMPHASQKEVMEAVGKKYRAEKAKVDHVSGDGAVAKQDKGAHELDAVTQKLEVIVLDDD